MSNWLGVFVRAHASSATGHRGRWVLMALLLGCLAACSSAPKVAESAALPSAVEPLAELLSRAKAAEQGEGGRERGRQLYRDAAKAYPTDKRPWLRLAQSYFDASDYGNAVLAAQEVVQRDPSDAMAQGMLAVCGLRISTAALAAMRSQNSLTSSTRSEAEDMARNLRGLLGEPVLVPKPLDIADSTPKPTYRPLPRATIRPRSSAASVAPTAPAAASAPSNPFGVLK